MKTLCSILLTSVVATSALAQGKVRLVNDSLHLVYFTTETTHLIDPALAGHPYVAGQTAVTLTIELWAGTSSSSLVLVGNTGFGSQPFPGTWQGLNVTLPFPAGGPAYFQILIYDATEGSWWQAFWDSHYVGRSPIFTAVAGTASYYSLANHNSPVNSTWADGTYNLDSLLPGYRGAIELGAYNSPEPSVFALSALALSLLLLRCRTETKEK